MGIAYGSVLQTQQRTYKVGREKKIAERKSSGWTGLFRILITILEVGAAIVFPESIALQVGLGLGAAAANTALSAREGNLTGIGLAVDFGSALIPGISGLRTASRIGRATTSELAEIGETAFLAGRREVMENAAYNAYTKSLKDAQAIAKGATKMDKQSLETAIDWARRAKTGTLSKAQEDVLMFAAHDLQIDAMGLANIAQKMQLEANSALSSSLEEVDREIKRLQDAFKSIKNMPIGMRVSNSKFLREAEKLIGSNRRELIKTLYLSPQKGWAKTASGVAFRENKVRSLTIINEAMDKLSDEGKDLFSIFLNRINYVQTMDAKAIEEELEMLMKSLSKNDILTFNRFITKDDFVKSFTVFSRQADSSTARRFIKYAGSAEFNRKWVQRLQLIDPNDMGRALPELAYQKLKNRILKKYEKNTFERAIMKAEKGLSRARKIEEAFVKSGGEILGSRYILGFKVLPGGFPGKRLVLVKFNKFNTSSKSGRNKGGKSDLLVTMSDEQIIRFREEGTSYWFAVGQKNGWFVSRGGKRVAGRSAGALSNNLSLFLGFVPVPALRNVLSIVSNWVENAFNIFGTHKYFKQWFPKLERALFRTAINRTVRLTTRVVIGGRLVSQANRAVSKIENRLEDSALNEVQRASLNGLLEQANKKVDVSKWIGRELQRVSGTVMTTFEGTTKKGYFTFTSGGTKNKSAGEILGRKLVGAALPSSLKSTATRSARRRGKYAGIKLVGAKRDLSQTLRVWSAVTPSGTKQLRSITRIKK